MLTLIFLFLFSWDWLLLLKNRVVIRIFIEFIRIFSAQFQGSDLSLQFLKINSNKAARLLCWILKIESVQRAHNCRGALKINLVFTYITLTFLSNFGKTISWSKLYFTIFFSNLSLNQTWLILQTLIMLQLMASIG